ncbi:MAG TPA: hypothetical protein VGS41_04110 [Chthonomonadales bacterium]|nr:hypothetical protein [Chthonomonadales bacterium]
MDISYPEQDIDSRLVDNLYSQARRLAAQDPVLPEGFDSRMVARVFNFLDRQGRCLKPTTDRELENLVRFARWLLREFWRRNAPKVAARSRRIQILPLDDERVQLMSVSMEDQVLQAVESGRLGHQALQAMRHLGYSEVRAHAVLWRCQGLTWLEVHQRMLARCSTAPSVDQLRQWGSQFNRCHKMQVRQILCAGELPQRPCGSREPGAGVRAHSERDIPAHPLLIGPGRISRRAAARRSAPSSAPPLNSEAGKQGFKRTTLTGARYHTGYPIPGADTPGLPVSAMAVASRA